ncbi:esterase-like activity of phytase family protein [Pseudonocardiaceae bacterium YIM PH 21723]|nr:esterase-like activity of phytase family protein [Pseudonocardiaceae bacterium YIM PH 21723]
MSCRDPVSPTSEFRVHAAFACNWDCELVLRNKIALLALTPALVLGMTSVAVADSAAKQPEVTKVSTLPRIPLAQFSNGMIPGSVADDRGVHLGGIGSGLYPAGRPGEFWTITDRGPNGQVKVGEEKRRTFPVPTFDPAIVRVKQNGDKLDVLRSIPIRNWDRKAVTGLSNQESRDEKPYDWSAKVPGTYNPEGLDAEDIVVAKDGSFWIIEEYSPSIVHIAPDGYVLGRYVPKGLNLKGAKYPVHEVLPGALLSRKVNRGFEGLTISPDGRYLYAAMQSPLLLPDKKAGEASRNTRILKFDLWEHRITGEYVYRFDDIKDFDPKGEQADMKISGLAMIDRNTLLVDERTDNLAKLYKIDLSKATNVLGKVDDPAAKPSLEQLDEKGLADKKITVTPKNLIVDLSKLKGVPGKIEGVAVLNDRTIAVINDNDFGMTDGAGAFDDKGRLKDSNVPTQLFEIKLPTSLR